jgi:small subunit ribosomal protein S5
MLNNQDKQEKISKTQKTKPQNIIKSKWNERVAQISRVTKVCKGGKKLSFKAIMIVGNELGQVGVGVGKADDVINAISKGITDAKKNLINVPITKSNTIPHLTIGRSGACQTIIKPASQGTGVIAGGSIRTVLELAGVKNILAKQLGGNNILNNARATISALANLKTTRMVAAERNLPLEHFYS